MSMEDGEKNRRALRKEMGTCGPQGTNRAGVMEAAAKPPSRLEEQGLPGPVEPLFIWC